MLFRFFWIALIILCSSLNVFGQLEIPSTFGKGIPFIAEDSSFSVKMRFRFQTLYDGDFNLESKEWSDGLIIRRSRLKFDGFVWDPRVVYKVELALSNRDTRGGQTVQNGITPNIILDAVIKWKVRPSFSIWFGQTKLPGNRERVISSQQLQFVDRSLINSRFSLDRDLGVQFRHKKRIGKAVIREIFAISMGEGRNIIIGNNPGYNYTGRVEFLPFGKFTNNGDYFGSDLEREENPKLSIGVTGNFNDNAVRSRGQLGNYVTDVSGDLLEEDMTSLIADFIYKHKGFSASGEFAKRWSEDPQFPFATGSGLVLQAGYLLKSNFEFAGRVASVKADTDVSTLANQDQYTLGFSRYVYGHNLKMQTDITYMDREGPDNLQYRFQVEVAF